MFTTLENFLKALHEAKNDDSKNDEMIEFLDDMNNISAIAKLILQDNHVDNFIKLAQADFDLARNLLLDPELEIKDYVTKNGSSNHFLALKQVDERFEKIIKLTADECNNIPQRILDALHQEDENKRIDDPLDLATLPKYKDLIASHITNAQFKKINSLDFEIALELITSNEMILALADQSNENDIKHYLSLSREVDSYEQLLLTDAFSLKIAHTPSLLLPLLRRGSAEILAKPEIQDFISKQATLIDYIQILPTLYSDQNSYHHLLESFDKLLAKTTVDEFAEFYRLSPILASELIQTDNLINVLNRDDSISFYWILKNAKKKSALIVILYENLPNIRDMIRKNISELEMKNPDLIDQLKKIDNNLEVQEGFNGKDELITTPPPKRHTSFSRPFVGIGFKATDKYHPEILKIIGEEIAWQFIFGTVTKVKPKDVPDTFLIIAGMMLINIFNGEKTVAPKELIYFIVQKNEKEILASLEKPGIKSYFFSAEHAQASVQFFQEEIENIENFLNFKLENFGEILQQSNNNNQDEFRSVISEQLKLIIEKLSEKLGLENMSPQSTEENQDSYHLLLTQIKSLNAIDEKFQTTEDQMNAAFSFN